MVYSHRMTIRLMDRSALKWLYPGMHIKRWLVLLLFGVCLMGLGISYVLREAYLSYTFPGAFYYITLQFIPRWTRGVLFMMLSLSTVGISVWKLNQSLLFAFVRPVWLRLTIGLVFAAPAAVAGYHAVHGIAKHAMPSETWQFIFSVVGAIAVGGRQRVKF